MIYVEKRQNHWRIVENFIDDQLTTADSSLHLGLLVGAGGTRLWNPLDGTVAQSTGGLAYGLLVMANTPGECLNIRREAIRTSPIVQCVADKQQLIVEAGPIDADGIRWWQVRLRSSPEVWGWASSAFLTRLAKN